MVGNRHAALAAGRPIVNLLLIEDHLAEARFLQEVLKGSGFSRFDLTHAKRLSEALTLLASADRFDVVLLDLTLPDSHGLASLDLLIQHAPSLPIVVLTNTNDEDLAVEAVRLGAQDYLVKRQINQDSLVRSLRYAIERKQTAEALREANEILELRVQERTAELAEANDRLQQEIQRRQRTQERLELAQQAGKIGSFEWHIPSNAITWTAELEALYGVAPGTFDHCDQGWLQALHPDDRLKTEQELRQAIAAGQGLDTEFRILLPSGGVRWIAVKSSLFRDDDTGAPLRLIGIHMDITEKKQLEAQFLRAQRLESLGTLASGIAHDLNNILTPILGIVQLLPLKLRPLDPSTKLLLSTAEASALRGADLIKQILSFARGVEGKRVDLQLQHLLLEIQKIVQQTVPKSIAIATDLPRDLWTVLGDATQLHQVFLNLCVNARDAMPTGGTLTIAAANLQMDEQTARAYLDAAVGAYVRVTIADTGTGIAPDVLQRIFDPFFTTKAIGKGTGLGLSAVLGIVKSHGGFIDVQSSVGQGSQFHVFLPASPTKASAAEPALAPLAGQQELILVVDDEAAVRESTRSILETYHYRVVTASEGMEALALLIEHRDAIRAVLMDMMMPTMDGLATLPLLHRLNPDLPVVAISGLNSIEAVAQAEQMGFRLFLAKPFTARELLHVVQQIKSPAPCC